LNGPAIAALMDQRGKTTSQVWVFADADGNPRRPEWLTTMWSKYRRAKNATATLHHLRHYFATQALEGGATLAGISSQLGHADVAITARVYSHGTAEGRRAASAAVALALEPATDETPAP